MGQRASHGPVPPVFMMETLWQELLSGDITGPGGNYVKRAMQLVRDLLFFSALAYACLRRCLNLGRACVHGNAETILL